MNKDDLKTLVNDELNPLTENIKCETHAELLVDVITANLNLHEATEQVVNGELRLTGGLTNNEGELKLTIPDKDKSPGQQASTAMFNKTIMDNRYWKKPWSRGSNSGVPDLNIVRDEFADAATEIAFITLWDAVRIPNDDLENDAAKGTWETSFHITDDWNWFPMDVGQVTVSRTVDDNGHATLRLFVSSHQNTTQYEGTFEQSGWSGWISVIQASNYANTNKTTLDGETHLSVDNITTGIMISGMAEVGQALTLVGNENTAASGHGEYIAATAANYINGITVALLVDENGSDCMQVAETPGIYKIPMLNLTGIENHARLYINVDDTILSFDDGPGSKNIGYVINVDSKSVFLDVVGSNSHVNHDEPPNPDAVTVLHGWTDNISPTADDLEFAATTQEEGYRTRDAGVSTETVYSRNCNSIRAEESYKYFFICLPKGVANPEPSTIKLGPLSYPNDSESSEVFYNGVEYTVLTLTVSNNADDDIAMFIV